MILTRMGVVAASKPAVAGTVDITLYSSQGATELDLAGYTIYYSTDLCSGWDLWPSIADCPISDACSQYGTLTISQNTPVYIAVKDCFGNFISYGGVDNDSACPTDDATYCYDYDSCTGTAFSFNSGTTNKDVAIGVFTSKIGYQICI
jgi:hypothetical protein